MMILAIDTSHAVGSVALSRDGGLLGAATLSAPATHLVELARAIERLLGANGLTARDVSRVAVVLGPGSFTGVRIAVAYAKHRRVAPGVEQAVQMVGVVFLVVQPVQLVA